MTKDPLVAGSKQFHPSITLHFDLSCRGFFCRDEAGVFQVADCHFSYGSYRKHRVSSPVTIRLRDVGSSSALLIMLPNRHTIITLVLRQDAWHTVRGNLQRVQVISQNFLARICTTDPYCCCTGVYRLGAVGTHQHYNLFNPAFSSHCLWPTITHIILQTVLPLRKTSTQCVIAINLPHHLKRLGRGFA